MPQVPGERISDRAKRLRASGEAALRQRLMSETGARRQVLIEGAPQGRTEHFLPVAISGETPGTVRALTITGNDEARLTVWKPSSSSPRRRGCPERSLVRSGSFLLR